MKPPSVSVFFPCYNDANSIGKLVLDAQSVLAGRVNDWEIIVVNDGSTDNSAEVLEKLCGDIPRLRIVTHRQNRGYGAALRSGFSASRKKLIFYTDGDGQYDAKELGILLPLMTREIDFVNGIKMNRKDPTHRVVLGNWYSFVARWMFWLPIYDVDCDFRLIRASIIKKYPSEAAVVPFALSWSKRHSWQVRGSARSPCIIMSAGSAHRSFFG